MSDHAAARRPRGGVPSRRGQGPGWAASVVALWLAAASLGAQGAPGDPALAWRAAAASQARRLVDSGVHPRLRWGRLDDFSAELRALYPDGGAELHWLREGQPTPAADALVAELEALAVRGLDPADYDAAWLRARLAGGRTALADPDSAAALDVGITVAALRVSWGLHRGLVRARDLHPGFRVTRRPFDVVATVRSLAATRSADSILTALEPDYLHYRLTRQALARYRALAADTTFLRLPPAPGRRTTVTPGMAWAGVPALRKLLVAEGDLLPTDAAGTASVYEGALVTAVRRYQRRNGLDSDGDIGPSTRRALERPFTRHLEALTFALERWRWLPRLADLPADAPLVLVNIPAFRLYAFRGLTDDERDLLMMDVVVGKALENETPVFANVLSQIVFAPYWEVPKTIAAEEIWPKVRRDPAYLARHHYEVVDGRVRQRPGPWNALGRVKFLFPNEYAIYMHDTPTRGPFRRARRDASHGCIRLADPRAFARWLLPDTVAWSDARLDEALARPTPLEVRVPKPRPVVITYATAMATQNGETLFYPDIYGHDARLRARLATGYPRAR